MSNETFIDIAGEREYVLPTTESLPLTAEAGFYLDFHRGLSTATVAKYGLGCRADGDIILPFIDHEGVRRLVKFRKPSCDGRYGTAKAIAEKGGLAILFGTHLCDQSKPLIIAAGEYDAMAIAEAGFENATSLPFGDGAHQFVRNQYDWLKGFRQIILWLDNDDKESSRQAEEKLVKRLGKGRVRLVRSEAKDANELLLFGGTEAVRAAIESAKWLPSDALIYLADYKEPAASLDGTPTSWGDINAATGGFRGKELVIVAGDNNAGKTTFVMNLAASNARDGKNTMIWSGEQPAETIRYWFELVAAGPANLRSQTSAKTGCSYWRAKPDVLPAIREWYHDRLIFLNQRDMLPDEFFELAEAAVCRYGVDSIVIDNLMAFTGGGNDQSYFTSQADFVKSCKTFAEEWNVTVYLCCHNKKGGNMLEPPDKWAIEGSLKISNWADYVLQLWRVPAVLREEEDGEYKGIDTVLSLCKNRPTGDLVDCAMVFDKASRRLVQRAEADAIFAEMGWESDDTRGGLTDEMFGGGAPAASIPMPAEAAAAEAEAPTLATLPEPLAISAAAPDESDLSVGDFWDGVAEDDSITSVAPVWVGGDGEDGEGIPF